jgi:hypothetical protein
MEEDLEKTLVPYVLTFGRNASHLNLDLDIGSEIVVLRVEDDDNAEFCRLLNHSNQLAFGGPNSMGMPLWVMLDCAILPAAMVGFMVTADDAPDQLWDLLEIEEDYEGWVPISEYCASISVEPGCVSGFSLHSHIASMGIATRTKALALAVLDAKAQVGVTQFDNPAIRVHARFGPMEILLHRPAVHTHSMDSFVYRLNLPELRDLESMAREVTQFGDRRRPEGVHWNFDPTDERAHARLRTHMSAGGRAWIVSPGWKGTTDGCEIDIVLGE